MIFFSGTFFKLHSSSSRSALVFCGSNFDFFLISFLLFERRAIFYCRRNASKLFKVYNAALDFLSHENKHFHASKQRLENIQKRYRFSTEIVNGGIYRYIFST